MINTKESFLNYKLNFMKRLIFLLLMLITTFAYSQTYYVGPSGNDATGDGSQAKPWKTLRNATLTVTPGTGNKTIFLLPGTYTESASTLNLPVGVNLEGADAATTIVKAGMTGQWSTFLNLESSSLTNGNQYIKKITFDGQYVSETNYKTWFGIWVTLRNNVTIDSCVFKNFYQRGLIINGNGHNEEPTDPGIYATGFKFTNNTVTNCGGNDGNTYGQLNIGGTKDAIISNNYMDQTQRPGTTNGECIKYWGSGYNMGLKILNNTLKRANHVSTQYNGSNGDWNFAVELFNNSGLEIAGNTIQGSVDLNYQRIVLSQGHTYSVWIHDNTWDHNPVNNKEEQGIIFEFETNGFIVENNKFLNQSTGITFNVRPPGNDGGFDNPPVTGGYSATTNGSIKNNLFTLYNLGSNCCSRQGIQFYVEGETKTAYARNITIEKNTFINLSPVQDYCFDFSYFGVQSNGTPAISGLTIKDNILIGFKTSYLAGGSSMANVTVTNNCVWNCGNNNNAAWSGASFSESTNLKVNPSLDANYLVPSSSPIYGKGIGYQSSGTPPPPVECTSYVYSAWSACINGQQTRTVVSSLPSGCVGGPAPVLTQSCTVDPGPCTYTYSAWGPCVNGVQTRTVVTALPAGCTGTPVLTQTCTVVPPADTTLCSIIIHLPATGNVATKRNLTYFVKRADGFYYDNTGTKLDIILYKQGGKWYKL